MNNSQAAGAAPERGEVMDGWHGGLGAARETMRDWDQIPLNPHQQPPPPFACCARKEEYKLAVLPQLLQLHL